MTSVWRPWHNAPPPQLACPSRAFHVPVKKVLDEVAHLQPLKALPREDAHVARQEVLQHIVEHEQPTAAEWTEWAGLQEPTQTSRGIKRQRTPDSKVVTPLRPNIKQKVVADAAPVCKGEVACQVCQAPSSCWADQGASLVNVIGQPLTALGAFCSRECFAHA